MACALLAQGAFLGHTLAAFGLCLKRQPPTLPPRPLCHGLPFLTAGPSAAGDLRVGGPFLFKEYWGRPEATADAFDEDGMFKTGDVVALEGQPPYFKVRCRCVEHRAADRHVQALVGTACL